MDYSILYVILISVAVIGLAILFYYLKRKHNIKNEDIFRRLDKTEMLISFGIAIAKDMDFGNTNTIENLKEVLLETLEYIKIIIDNENDSDVIINEAILKAKEMCLVFDIELNDEREYIIKAIITATFNLYNTIDFVEE
jgi:hypothetical protein